MSAKTESQLNLSDKSGEVGLIEDLGQYVYNPLAFVYAAYPWGNGVLEGFKGPDAWQTEMLQEIGLKVTGYSLQDLTRKELSRPTLKSRSKQKPGRK
jgi:hypothetical protein